MTSFMSTISSEATNTFFHSVTKEATPEGRIDATAVAYDPKRAEFLQFCDRPTQVITKLRRKNFGSISCTTLFAAITIQERRKRRKRRKEKLLVVTMKKMTTAAGTLILKITKK